MGEGEGGRGRGRGREGMIDRQIDRYIQTDRQADR